MKSNKDFETFLFFLNNNESKLPLFYHYLACIDKENASSLNAYDKTFSISDYQNKKFHKKNDHYRPILKIEND